MGNSEVGHNAIGAGRVFAQGAKLVNHSIESGDIFKTPIWEKILKQSEAGGTVHLMGLLSDGNVHSHMDHIFALVNKLEESEVKKVRLHILADGRDVGEKSALSYIKPTEELLATISQAERFDYQIASGGGRMITTMDRYDADWSIVERGWKAHVLGKARPFKSASEAIQTMYDEDPGITDQYLEAFTIVGDDDKPVGTIEDGDAVVFWNFRGDRAIEISKAFESEEFDKFDRKRVPSVFFAGMMEYDGDLHIPAKLPCSASGNRQTNEFLSLCRERYLICFVGNTEVRSHDLFLEW